MATRRDKKRFWSKRLRSLFLFSLCEEIHKKFTTHQEKHRNLMKLYISHIILLTIKTCAPLVEGEMLNTIEKRDCGWKQEKTFLQQQLFFFPSLHFQLLIVFKKQFSRRIFSNKFSSLDLARVVFNLRCEQFSHKIPNIYKKWKFLLFLKLFFSKWLIFFWRIQSQILCSECKSKLLWQSLTFPLNFSQLSFGFIFSPTHIALSFHWKISNSR